MTLARKGAGQVELKLLANPGEFRATFSTFNVVDADGDVTLPGAFEDGAAVKIAAWGHNWGELPVGKGVIHQDETSAWVEGTFFLDTDGGKETYQTVKALGDLQEWSYGYEPLEVSFGEFDGSDVRFLRRLTVYEVSPVLVGAGVGTRTDEIKSQTSLADEHDAALAAVSALVARVKALAALRAKEGRTLSEANRQRLAAMLDALRSLTGEVDALLTETAPPKQDDQLAVLHQALTTLQKFRAA